MPRTIDLNADLGEGCPWDRPLLDRVTSASVCCGAHAGEPETILQTLRWARERGVVVGAHPGYPDRAGFGRRDMEFSPKMLTRVVKHQVRDLAELASVASQALRFLKPHGALYNRAQRDQAVSRPVLSAASVYHLPILGQPGSQMEEIVRGFAHPFITEGFADRRYTPDGRLVPRSEPDAILHDPDEIRAQVLSLVDRGIKTLCIHGDDPRSVELADLVLATLKGAGIEPRSFL